MYKGRRRCVLSNGRRSCVQIYVKETVEYQICEGFGKDWIGGSRACLSSRVDTTSIISLPVAAPVLKLRGCTYRSRVEMVSA